MSGAFGEIAEQLRRVTVQVLAGRTGRGSGVIWTRDGQVVTNAHVLGGNHVEVELWSGQRFPASIRSLDRRRDLGVLQVNAGGLYSAVQGDSDALRPGELVIAVGSPYGFIGAVSTGVIHSVGTQLGLPARRWVASDVRLAPGNSGGPLANAKGEVIGLNTMIAGGLSLAIPSRSVRRFLAGTFTGPPYFGVTMRPVPLNEPVVRVGFLILEIADQSPAARASLLPGDLLTGAVGRSFRDPEDLEDALSSTAMGSWRSSFAGERAHQAQASDRAISHGKAESGLIRVHSSCAIQCGPGGLGKRGPGKFVARVSGRTGLVADPVVRFRSRRLASGCRRYGAGRISVHARPKASRGPAGLLGLGDGERCATRSAFEGAISRDATPEEIESAIQAVNAGLVVLTAGIVTGSFAWPSTGRGSARRATQRSGA